MHNSFLRSKTPVWFALGILAAIAVQRALAGDGPLTPVHNVTWSLKDYISACPAGDSVIAGHPCRLRIEVSYADANGNNKVGVPPESIYVMFTADSGNVRANDLATKTYADDSTKDNQGELGGFTRIQVPSFSGQGRLLVTLLVSGHNVGTKTVHIRTTDPDASGRDSLGSDQSAPGDIDWSGTVTQADRDTAAVHIDHWHRNALHGTLVRRTNLCDTCKPAEPNTRGFGQLSWSPSQRFIAYTRFLYLTDTTTSCKVFMVPATPNPPNDTPIQVTSSSAVFPIEYHDYDPVWSPRGQRFFFDRGDSVIVSKGVPWSSDTSEIVVSAGDCGLLLHGDDTPAVSPDGIWIAFSRCNPPAPNGPGGWSIWKGLATGGNPIRLTGANGQTDFYPSWSPDGSTIYFQRQDPNSGIGPAYAIYSIPASGGDTAVVYVPNVPFSSYPDTVEAVQPSLSPDAAVLVMGSGKRAYDRPHAPSIYATTLDPSLSNRTRRVAIPQYVDTVYAVRDDNTGDPNFPVLSPRLSPDGTRLALGAKQIWAARRNMNQPPVITKFGSQSINDTTTFIGPIDVYWGGTTNFAITYADPEGDLVTCSAQFVQPWMAIENCVFSCTPPASTIGHMYFVQILLSTPSGGYDWLIVQLHVIQNSLGPMGDRAEVSTTWPRIEILGANPTRTPFVIRTAGGGKSRALLTILDVSGRVVARVQGRVGDDLWWNGKTPSGAPAGSGIYFYHARIPGLEKRGRVVVVR